jgi:hypothetical protein
VIVNRRVSCWAQYAVLTGEIRNAYRKFVEFSKKSGHFIYEN